MIVLRRLLTGLAIVLAAFCGAAVLLMGRPSFGWQALSVPTASMQPNISQGSMVLVHRVPDSTLKVGDVITHTNPLEPRTTLTHRIVKTYTISKSNVPVYITKGDANPSDDIPIAGGDVQGKVVGHVPMLGGWMMWAKTWVGIAVLVYLPAAIVMAEEVRKLSAYYKLSMPYRLYPLRRQRAAHYKAKYTAAAMAGMLLVTGIVFDRPVLALISSNTVALTPNHITVVGKPKPPTCSNSNTVDTINVNNSSTQTATSGGAPNSGDTTGGTATSGGASNSNSTNVTVNISDGC